MDIGDWNYICKNFKILKSYPTNVMEVDILKYVGLRIENLEELKELGRSNLEVLIKRQKRDVSILKEQLEELMSKPIKDMIKNKRKIKEIIDKIKIKNTIISIFEDLVAKSPDKRPYIPQLRPYDLFNVGDEVVVYIGDSKNSIVSKRFIVGKVIEDYRHHDGMVSFIANEKWHTGDYYDGRGGFAGLYYPGIMLKWELEYLMSNPSFLELWLRQIDGFEHFKEDIKEESCYFKNKIKINNE